MDFFQHLVNAVAMFAYKNLMKCALSFHFCNSPQTSKYRLEYFVKVYFRQQFCPMCYYHQVPPFENRIRLLVLKDKLEYKANVKSPV